MVMLFQSSTKLFLKFWGSRLVLDHSSTLSLFLKLGATLGLNLYKEWLTITSNIRLCGQTRGEITRVIIG